MHLKKYSFGYSSLAGLVLVALGLLVSSEARSVPVPFDTVSARSEQLGFNASSPQIVGAATADSLTFSYQLYDSNSPTSTMLVHFTRTGSNYTKAWDKQLPLPRLVGMTSDGSNFYIVSAASEDKSADPSPNVFRTNILVMTKLDKQGNQLWQRDLNNPAYLGADTHGAVYSPLTAGTGAVSYGAGKVIVALTSNTEMDANGFRHQRAQYFAVGADGAGFGVASETSWRHSFDQRLLFDGQDFIFTDLGDAGWYMPAGGITVRKFRPTANGVDFIGDQDNKQGTYIYARQSETAGNQNFTFTSIGDLQVGAQGYLALFTSEKGNPTVSRDGWSQPVTEPRNLGFVHVTRNFETVREGKWGASQTMGNTIIENNEPTKINISPNVVDSHGPSNTFQRPDKTNKTFTQSGIIWLTDLPAGMSAERSKLVKLANGRFVALWEEWSYSGTQLAHRATQGLIVNEQGQILEGPVPLKGRLNPSGADRPFLLDDKVAWITADAGTGKFSVYTVDTNLSLSVTAIDSSGLPQPTTFIDHLSAGDKLKTNDILQSNNGRYKLVYQTDGNLALYTAEGKFLWNTGTKGPAGSANMQTDGNFAIYTADGTFQWNTGTTSAGSRLVLQDDGNLVIITASGTQLWSSNTAQSRDRLRAGDRLNPGDKLQSSNGLYTLQYQPDGNLVLYSGVSTPQWSSGTNGQAAGYAVMQTDGNFAIYGADNGFQWNTGTTTAGSWIVLQADGNLVVYAPNGVALWETGSVQ